MHNDTQIHIKTKPFGDWERSDTADLQRFLDSKITVIQLTNESGKSIVLDLRIPLAQYAPDDTTFLLALNEKLRHFLKTYFAAYDHMIPTDTPDLTDSGLRQRPKGGGRVNSKPS